MRVDYVDDDEFLELERCLRSAEKRFSSRSGHQRGATSEAFAESTAAHKRSATDSPATLQQQAEHDVRKVVCAMPRGLFPRGNTKDQTAQPVGAASCEPMAEHGASVTTAVQAGSAQQSEFSKQLGLLHSQHVPVERRQWRPNMRHAVQDCNATLPSQPTARIAQDTVLQTMLCKQEHCIQEHVPLQNHQQLQEVQQLHYPEMQQQQTRPQVELHQQGQPQQRSSASSTAVPVATHVIPGISSLQSMSRSATARHSSSSSTATSTWATSAGQAMAIRGSHSRVAAAHVAAEAVGLSKGSNRLSMPDARIVSAQSAAAPQECVVQLDNAASARSSCSSRGCASAIAGSSGSNKSSETTVLDSSHLMDPVVHVLSAQANSNTCASAGSSNASSGALSITGKQQAQLDKPQQAHSVIPANGCFVVSNGQSSRETVTAGSGSSTGGTVVFRAPGQHAATAAATTGVAAQANSTAGNPQQKQQHSSSAVGTDTVHGVSALASSSAAATAASSGSSGRRRLPPSMRTAEMQGGHRQQTQQLQQEPGCKQQQQQVAPHGKPRQQMQYHGSIRYSCNPLEVDWLCRQMLDAGPPSVIGLDIEWRPTFKTGQAPNKTALLQIAYAVDKEGRDWRPKLHGRGATVLLLHVYYTGITPALQEVLQREDIIKVGVNIGGDVSKLLADFQVEVCGADDLSEAAHGRQLRCIEGITANIECKRWSLAGLVEELLDLELPKPHQVRLGNWERMPLSEEQKQYAALDAFASLLLHWELQALPERLTLSQQLRAAMRERAEAAIAASEGG